MILWHCKIIPNVLLLSVVASNGIWINFSPGNHEVFLYESKLIMRSLEKALKYIQKQPEDITADVILGVLIVNGNLQWIANSMKHYFHDSSWTNERVKQLLRQCKDIVEFNKFKNLRLLKEKLGEDAAENLKFGLLSQHDDDFFLPKFDSCQSIDTYMMKGSPENSDFCINELMRSECNVSEYCWFSEVNGGIHFGYKTSHRLLYFQIAFKMKCEELNPEKFSGIRTLKNKLCQQMLLEAKALFEKSSFFIIRDLFMEQIALCGLEGYEEFAPKIWRDEVRSWQNENGCFGQSIIFKNCTINAFRKNNFKRNIKATDLVSDNCHTHLTSVAISALAFFLRVTLKMAFNLP